MKLAVAVALLSTLSNAADGDNCELTKREPKKARYLKFCQDYNSKACCIPGHDLENQVQFENLIDGLGPGCKNPMMYPELRYFYCLGCDPDQPKATNNSDSTIKICKSFVDKLWSDPAYADCGVMYPNPCPDSWGYDGMDPYTCGDDLLLPKAAASWDGTLSDSELADHPSPTGIGFMNIFKPPGLDGMTFIEVPDSDPDCWNAPAFKNSAARLARTTGMLVMVVGLGMRWLL